MSPLSISLIISLVGMGLVFGAIVLLWGVMAALVRLAEGWRPARSAQQAAEAADLELKRRAAVAAVAIALATGDNNEPHEFPLPPTAIVGAWQAINRTRMLNKRGQLR